ncbi:hypothetical protein VT930_20385 [Mycobacterium sherrisii]|uniref:hypothetical protein n=1 Tax=Mycobacterium sherrisii TaxID=243061 RepID=UPI000A14A0B0|nr:hypothetical protein [Mycobacterium sherrisii]MEC4765436.1 hypothetical protein [Mycobacterium sherrisii]ORW78038.1 hypothetical protein AWC25_00055 [Mycobacterium sherrisii]
MSCHDAKAAAVALVSDDINGDDPAGFLRCRARLAAAGADNSGETTVERWWARSTLLPEGWHDRGQDP